MIGKTLSIIIPVYNVEQYLVKCLDSTLAQGLPKDEYEILIINDGSPDNSLIIAEDYSHKYSNVKVVSRANGGLSAARNTGIEHACGDYIWFVDGDDWIESNCIKSLLAFAEVNTLDVLCFGLQLAFEDGKKEKYQVTYEENGQVYSGSEFMTKVDMPPVAWAALYRRDFLQKHHLRFKEGILHEDQEFTPRAYYLAERIAYVDKVVYNYFQRSGSIMKSQQSAKRCRDLLTVADSLFAFMKEHVPEETEAYGVFQDKVNFAFSQSLAFHTSEAFPLSEYKQKEYYPLKCKKGLASKYKIANLSLRLYLLLRKLNKR